MSADQTVPNVNAPFIDPKTGKILPPWNTFLQMLVQPAQPIEDIDTNTAATGFTPNAIGTAYIEGSPSVLTLIRGEKSLILDLGIKMIPISIGDKLHVSGAQLKFIPQR